jgi:hypothetical protein
MALTKLASPLPRITPPSKLANGDTVIPWSRDPYLESASGIWFGTIGSVPAKRGIVFSTGIISQVITQQTIKTQSNGTLYCEVRNVKGQFYVYQGVSVPLFAQDGFYLLTDAASSVAQIGIDDTYFVYDPYFKSLPVGQLPILANIPAEAWCTEFTPTKCVKQDNGTIALSMAIGSSLMWKSAWAQANDVLLEIDIQSIPLGGALHVITGAGVVGQTITTPGKYSVVVNLNAGYDIRIGATNTGGWAIINSLKARRVTQSWTCEGLPFLQMTAFWSAEPTYFNRILNPQTIHMATSFERPNMQGWNPLAGEPILGYGQAPPPSGYFRVGDTIRNNCAIAGSVSGWRCTAAGNPGTWMPLATL